MFGKKNKDKMPSRSMTPEEMEVAMNFCSKIAKASAEASHAGLSDEHLLMAMRSAYLGIEQGIEYHRERTKA